MRLTTVVTIYRDHYQYQHLDKLCVDIQYTCPIVYCLEFQSWISLSSSYCLEFQSWISLSQYDLRLVNKSSQHQYPRIGLGRHIKEKNSTLDLNFNIRFLSIKPVFLCLWSLIYLTTFKVLWPGIWDSRGTSCHLKLLLKTLEEYYRHKFYIKISEEIYIDQRCLGLLIEVLNNS